MKRILFLSSIVALLSSCGGSGNGELIGGLDRSHWNPTDPYGMVFVPQGSFIMGPSDQDVPFANVSTNQRVSVGAFYMDETEITNNEYRQFERWVVDSIIRSYLGKFQTEGPRNEVTLVKSNYLINLAEIKNNDEISLNLYNRWMGEDEEIGWREIDPTEDDENYEYTDDDEDLSADYFGGVDDERAVYLPKIDWNARISKDERKEVFHNLFVKSYVDGEIVKEENNFIYRYEFLDVKALANQNEKNEETIDDMSGSEYRNTFVVDTVVNIYPSTLDYQSDYAYANNETDAILNYEHIAFDDYPVVGITWHQANAFCHWRTHIINSFLRANNEPILPDFRLPTETEWEYAARGGLSLSPYPWGGPYTRNMKGCFLANFKPLRGNYTADGGLKAIKVRQYNPNNYGLYDMSGNVAEWTSTVFDETSTSYSHDMNSDNSYISEESDLNVLKRKVVRGGSWKDISYFIQTSTRAYEYDDVSTSYIGFRCVMDFLGRDKKDFN